MCGGYIREGKKYQQTTPRYILRVSAAKYGIAKCVLKRKAAAMGTKRKTLKYGKINPGRNGI